MISRNPGQWLCSPSIWDKWNVKAEFTRKNPLSCNKMEAVMQQDVLELFHPQRRSGLQIHSESQRMCRRRPGPPLSRETGSGQRAYGNRKDPVRILIFIDRLNAPWPGRGSLKRSCI